MTTALTIYQEHLDEVSQCLWERDFEALAELMTYPHELVTEHTPLQVDTPEILIEWARRFRQGLEKMGATAYLRVAVAAAFNGDDETRIDGFHRVYVLRGARHLIDPYSSEARLAHVDGRWLGSGVRAVMRATRYPITGIE